MKKNKGFMKSFKKSTQVTVLSCASFIAMTVILLVFLSAFPITPSEKIMASIGRENILENNNPDNSNIPSAISSVVKTEKNPEVTTAVKNSVTTDITTTKTFKIVITTGSGFNRNHIVSANNANANTNTKTTVIYDDPPVPTYDPGYVYPVYTEPPVIDDPPVTDVPPEYNPENPVTDYPPVTDIPVWTEPPVVTDVPPVTEPPVVWTDPPVIDIPPVTDPPPVWVDPVEPNPPVVDNPVPDTPVSEW